MWNDVAVLVDSQDKIRFSIRKRLCDTFAQYHAVLVGDPLQLAPIVKLQDRRKKRHTAYWLGTDIFSHLGIILKDAESDEKPVVLLSQQSRMLPEIAAPVSRMIYDGQLHNRLHRNSLFH